MSDSMEGRLYDALKRVQWGSCYRGCPACGADEMSLNGKHYADCEIGEALAEWEDNEANWNLFFAVLCDAWDKAEKKI